MEIKFTYLQFTLYLCVVCILSAIPGVFERENRGGKFRASSFLFIYFFILLSNQTFINRSIQNTFKFAFYINRSRLIRLRQISNNNFIKAPLTSTVFLRCQLCWFRIKNWSRVHLVTQKQNYLFSAYHASRDILCPHEKCFSWERY